MKKLSEAIWNDIRKQSTGKQERQEDKFVTNLNEIVPVDLGLDVLWADRDLEVDGEVFIPLDIANALNTGEWRRPTGGEADQLFSSTKWSWVPSQNNQQKPEKITMERNDVILSFDYYWQAHTSYQTFWEKEKGKNEDFWNAFEFQKSADYFPHTAFGMEPLESKCRIRLVKDK